MSHRGRGGGPGGKRGYGFSSAAGRNQSKRQKMELNPDSHGVVFTISDPRMAWAATKDVLSLLKEYLPDEDGKAEEAEGSGEGGPSGGVDAGLEAETAALAAERNKKEKGRVFACQGISKTLGFIQFARKEDVASEVLLKVLQDVKKSQRRVSRFVHKLLPVDRVCKPHFTEFLKLATEVVKENFPGSAVCAEDFKLPVFGAQKKKEMEKEKEKEKEKEGEGAASSSSSSSSSGTPGKKGAEAGEGTVTWAVQFTSRNMKTIDRNDATDAIAHMVGREPYAVNINDPMKAVVVEVNPLFCGFSVVREWQGLEKYNVLKLVGEEEGGQGEAAVKGKEAEEEKPEEKGEEEGEGAEEGGGD
uniref:THUMP domain-containing protein n=1 Tax=Chromera velia CCMP2878 TaxID=1169474 RepID=A0A0G4FPX3_9ALVE|eukprot:Cvel_18170.t1-p1 / transcript=Cvel_18170.t1 / gene=Cvel_18170 / organism=Chromera_velia_CCMP2878 / gene_product=hypothetical protein / transcript_product=hypothetical protein / location=Cvel_scaffold1490:19963-23346(+) / protein_length=358 / sequence_SO=supercontig / SO=protein_coding / is_pseudo=false